MTTFNSRNTVFWYLIIYVTFAVHVLVLLWYQNTTRKNRLKEVTKYVTLVQSIPSPNAPHRHSFIAKTFWGRDSNVIRINAGNGISEDSRVITQGVRQGCPLLTVLFNLYLDEVIRIWLKKLKTSKYFKQLIFNTLAFADDQFIIYDR
jgi:hypothetical protein